MVPDTLPIDLNGFRAVLQSATSVLGPRIDGLEDLTKATLSAQAIRVVSKQLASHRTRLQLVKSVIDDIDALVLAISALANDGYPSTPTIFVPEEILEEITREIAAIGSAVSIFSSGILTLDIAGAVLTSQPIPMA